MARFRSKRRQLLKRRQKIKSKLLQYGQVIEVRRPGIDGTATETFQIRKGYKYNSLGISGQPWEDVGVSNVREGEFYRVLYPYDADVREGDHQTFDGWEHRVTRLHDEKPDDILIVRIGQVDRIRPVS